MASGAKRMGTTKLQERGQLTIPAEIRRTFGWRPGDSVMFTARADGVLELRVLRRAPVGELLEKYSVDGAAPDVESLRDAASVMVTRDFPDMENAF